MKNKTLWITFPNLHRWDDDLALLTLEADRRWFPVGGREERMGCVLDIIPQKKEKKKEIVG